MTWEKSEHRVEVNGIKATVFCTYPSPTIEVKTAINLAVYRATNFLRDELKTLLKEQQ